jgi:U3 small nucleolar RNA-associated protein 25
VSLYLFCSSFHRHVSHIITNEEVKALMKKNYKFKWEMPAVDIPRSKWVGTVVG